MQIKICRHQFPINEIEKSENNWLRKAFEYQTHETVEEPKVEYQPNMNRTKL